MSSISSRRNFFQEFNQFWLRTEIIEIQIDFP